MDRSSEVAPPVEVAVTRGGRVESVHHVLVSVVDAGGHPLASAGDVSRVVFYRSAAKPMQALPLVEDGVVEALPLTELELALCCASHNAEPRHVETARGILAKAGVGVEALACGPHPPMAAGEAERLIRSGGQPSAVHNNCSGKHAGMLALAHAHGWPAEGYHLPEHPVQQRMLAEVSRWTGLSPDAIGTGTDGCGVVCFAVPLDRMALSFARFAGAAARGDAPAVVVRAMTAHPAMVAGSGRLCTALMERAGERVFAKTGAEGVYCAAVRDAGIGVALKVLDGSRRAADAALVRVLELLGVLGVDDVESLGDFAAPLLRNTRGEIVGELSARFTLSLRDAAGCREELPRRARDRRDVTRGEELPRPRSTAVTGALAEAEALLVDVSAALAARGEGPLAAALASARDAVVEPLFVEEVLLQSYLFLGYPAALNGLALWRELSGRPAAPPAEQDWEAWRERGERVCRRVYAEQFEALFENVRALHADLAAWMLVEGYGKVLGRDGLDLRVRELCIVALLAVLDAPRQLRSHLRGALHTGATPEQLDEVLVRALAHAGEGARARALDTWTVVRSRWSARANEE